MNFENHPQNVGQLAFYVSTLNESNQPINYLTNYPTGLVVFLSKNGFFDEQLIGMA